MEREREREREYGKSDMDFHQIEFALCLLFALCEFCKTGLITEMGNISNLFLSQESSKRREMLKRVRWQT
jgi:hypothetical protein